MIIGQTPFRISFFGGGTDWPEFFREHGGAVIGSTIDKHLYHSATPFHSQLFDYSIRLAYRNVECVRTLDEIQHRPFREILRHFGVTRDIEISLASELPAYTGIGSSSSFTVGLINVLSALRGRFISKRDLAQTAIRLERECLGEAVGCQDQVFAAFGGLNLVEFARSGDFTVHRLSLAADRLDELDRSLLLFFTGITRRAHEVEREKIARIPQTKDRLLALLRLVEQAHAILTGGRPLSEFGALLDRGWREKRGLGPGVSSPAIDRMYDRAIEAGALGGKLLGAGGGGFLLLFVPPERQPPLREALSEYGEVPFHLNSTGSHIIHS